MKTIGLIGGMSWESTLVYYKLINEYVKAEKGGFHSAKCIIDSVDFSEIEALQRLNNWKKLNEMMVTSAQKLEQAGANLIVLCTNTMHLCSEQIETNITIPFLHIAQVTGEEVSTFNFTKVGLLGTKFTMEQDFYKNILKNQFGIETIIPKIEDRNTVHQVIYNELTQGIFKPSSKKKYINIVNSLIEKGAQGIILGCTEIPLLISQKDINVPVFDTTAIHAKYAVKMALR